MQIGMEDTKLYLFMNNMIMWKMLRPSIGHMPTKKGVYFKLHASR